MSATLFRVLTSLGNWPRERLKRNLGELSGVRKITHIEGQWKITVEWMGTGAPPE